MAGCRIDNCDSCFSKDFCTKCKSGFYVHKGRCFDECPEGFSPSESMECVGQRKTLIKKKKKRKLLDRAQKQHSVVLATERTSQ
ncbi:R-spondin-2 [Acipenser ruthenus]|uniref:R-spondin-2 n=1 Tax=Acipenser ruthenus TaxID=7906 RepID=A0A444UJR4_ACIRT|nr:R-spondin-2 [Acipenser ruthenus]